MQFALPWGVYSALRTGMVDSVSHLQHQVKDGNFGKF